MYYICKCSVYIRSHLHRRTCTSYWDTWTYCNMDLRRNLMNPEECSFFLLHRGQPRDRTLRPRCNLFCRHDYNHTTTSSTSSTTTTTLRQESCPTNAENMNNIEQNRLTKRRVDKLHSLVAFVRSWPPLHEWYSLQPCKQSLRHQNPHKRFPSGAPGRILKARFILWNLVQGSIGF